MFIRRTIGIYGVIYNLKLHNRLALIELHSLMVPCLKSDQRKMKTNRILRLFLSSGVSENQKSKNQYFIGSHQFPKVVRATYIDKSMLIKDFIESDYETVVVTAPPGFGKSLNMNMIKHFFEIQVDEQGIPYKNVEETVNYRLFSESNLDIFNEHSIVNEYLGRYPIIFIDFNHVCGVQNLEDILSGLKTALNEAFNQHTYLLQDLEFWNTSWNKESCLKYFDPDKCENLTIADIRKGLFLLSKLLYSYYRKQVILLVDEFDAPLKSVIYRKEIDLNLVDDLMTKIIVKTLKGNNFLYRTLLNSVGFLTTLGISDLHNIKVCKFLDEHPFVKFYGLTEKEVTNLLENSNLKPWLQEKAKRSYKGYLSLNRIEIYNTWSIINFISTGNVRNYWAEITCMKELISVFKIHDIEKTIAMLIRGENVSIVFHAKITVQQLKNLQRMILYPDKIGEIHKDIFLQFLFDHGYLTYSRTKCLIMNTHYVKIPNEEVKREFCDKLRDFYIELCLVGTDTINKVIHAFGSLTERSRPDEFTEFLYALNGLFRSIRTTNPSELLYHDILFSVLLLEYTVSGTGTKKKRQSKSLNVLILKNIGVIMEVKYNSTSKRALEDIVNRGYYYFFENDDYLKKYPITHKFILGINISDTRNVTMSYLIGDAKKDIFDIKNAVHLPEPFKYKILEIISMSEQ